MLIARHGEEIVCPRGTLCGRIVRDAQTGVETIRTHDGRTLAAVDDLGGRSLAAAPSRRPLTLAAFVDAIDRRARALERRR